LLPEKAASRLSRCPPPTAPAHLPPLSSHPPLTLPCHLSSFLPNLVYFHLVVCLFRNCGWTFVGQVLLAAGGRELLLSTNNNGATCLHSACRNAHLEVVEVLRRSLSLLLSLSLALSLS
jgi:ankyrin repeat protein